MTDNTEHKRRKAFTLAEILITLGIIGVVAAMTIPTLIANTNAQKYRSQLIKNNIDIKSSCENVTSSIWI